jgi:hypothetical protein
MSRRREASLSLALLLISSGLCACGGAASRKPEPASAVAAQASLWGSLLVAPLGSLLTQVPVALREVLLFREDERGLAESEEQECYAKSGVPFVFDGNPLDDYVLCFTQEHLYRVEAATHWQASTAATNFTAFCSRWLLGATNPEQDAEHCAGRSGEVEYIARLAQPAAGAIDAALTITVTNLPQRADFESRVQQRLQSKDEAP